MLLSYAKRRSKALALRELVQTTASPPFYRHDYEYLVQPRMDDGPLSAAPGPSPHLEITCWAAPLALRPDIELQTLHIASGTPGGTQAR